VAFYGNDFRVQQKKAGRREKGRRERDMGVGEEEERGKKREEERSLSGSHRVYNRGREV